MLKVIQMFLLNLLFTSRFIVPGGNNMFYYINLSRNQFNYHNIEASQKINDLNVCKTLCFTFRGLMPFTAQLNTKLLRHRKQMIECTILILHKMWTPKD